MYKEISSQKVCTGCMACVDSCNKNAIVITNVGGILYPQIDIEKCVDCGLCKKVCPANNLPQRAKLEETKVYAAWSKSDEIRHNAASGGFCTQMGLDTIKRGGYVATVIMKDNHAKYILTNNVDDLLKGSNSKYVQGNPAVIYSKIRKLLNAGEEVLFNGLPCYCAGLKNYLRKDYDNLTTIDLVCSAPPSTDAISMTLEYCNASNLFSFRKKVTGGMWGEGDHNLVVDNNLIISQKKTVFYDVFASMMTARKSCMNCQYARLERGTDFTAADFHGYRCENSEKGVSLVIANNPTAVTKIQEIEGLHVISETWLKAVNSNPRLYNGYDFLRYHPGIIFRNRLRGTNLFKKMCLNDGLWRLLWLPFKAITKIVIKFKYNNAIKVAAKLDSVQ